MDIVYLINEETELSENYIVLLSDGGFIEAKNLKVGDTVMCEYGYEILIETIKKIDDEKI